MMQEKGSWNFFKIGTNIIFMESYFIVEINYNIISF